MQMHISCIMAPGACGTTDITNTKNGNCYNPEVAEAMGVVQQTVSMDTTNTKNSNGCKPDRRVKMTPTQKKSGYKKYQF